MTNGHRNARGQQLQTSSFTFPNSYDIEVTPPAYSPHDLVNPWGEATSSQPSIRVRAQSMVDGYGRPPSRSASASITGATRIAFPEPQLSRSTSQRETLSPPSSLIHRISANDLRAYSVGANVNASTVSFRSAASSINDDYGDYLFQDASQELSNLTLDSDESIRRFQQGQLSDTDQEWHRLVPTEAREALGKQEVQRQSVLFELFKAEKDYVSDLETVQEIFIEGLRNASPAIIPVARLPHFLNEVFGNLQDILALHQTMLGSLFARQRDQHPLVQSVSDIILETILKDEFRSAYETYIKHYPLAESMHRKELKTDRSYQIFMQSMANDPLVRKRDLITFLSRPVTRLPRLSLLLEQILKLTDRDHNHPDLETIPIILSILGDFIKSTQPGIEAAEGKVKLWELNESLRFQPGEIFDMDLYDESRTLVYTGPILRKTKTDSGRTLWAELHGALLDNFFLLTKEEKRPDGTVIRHLTSRPLPLSYLRLGPFDAPPESRKERSEEGGILDSLKSQTVPVYPFTIYHASSRSMRRYTLFVASESIRRRWRSFLVDALAVHRVRQDANMFFDPQNLTDRFFRVMSSNADVTNVRLTGKITAVAPFSSAGRRFLAVGCFSGIYVAPRGKEDFRRVFTYSNPESLTVLQSIKGKTFNKLIIRSATALVACSIDILARVALGQATPEALKASMETIVGPDSHLVLYKELQIGERVFLILATKRLLQVSMSLQAYEAYPRSALLANTQHKPAAASSFRLFGEPGYVPKDAHAISPLAKTVGICCNEGIVIMDPVNLGNSAITVVPDFSDAAKKPNALALKARLADANTLGLIRVDSSELLVIYDTLGCYISKHGYPSRSSGFIKWETKAASFAHRGSYVLLFSPQFIEIRQISTGHIVQIIEGTDIRLVHSGPNLGETDDTILVAMKGGKDDKYGASDKLVELVETTELTVTTPTTPAPPSVWDEWDM